MLPNYIPWDGIEAYPIGVTVTKFLKLPLRRIPYYDRFIRSIVAILVTIYAVAFPLS